MSLEKRIQDGLEGKYKGLANGFSDINKYIFGVQRKCYTLVGGASGSYKTTILDFIILNALIDAEKQGIPIDIFYYSFEIDEVTKKCNWTSQLVYMTYGTVIPPEKIKGLGDNRLSAEELALVKTVIPEVEKLFAKIKFTFEPTNPTGIYNELFRHCKTTGELIYEDYIDEHGKAGKRINGFKSNDDRYILVAIDHLYLCKKERNFSTKENMDKMSEYLVLLRNIFGISPFVLQQFNQGLTQKLMKILYICIMNASVYIIKNLVNKKVYIGSSVKVKRRFYEHTRKLDKNIHINLHLQAAWNKYGKNNFEFKVIYTIKKELIRKTEQFFINKYQSLNPKYGYNKTVVISNCWDDLNINKTQENKFYFVCYDKNGIIKKVFKTIQDVYDFLGGRYTRIYDACNSNFSKTCKNYYWSKINVTKDKIPSKIIPKERKGRHKQLYQYDLNMNFIKNWSCAAEAARVLKLSSFNITRCLRKNNKYKNFYWFYSPVV